MWTAKYILYSLLAVVLTFLMHEFFHWIMGVALGYEMRMTLNTVYPLAGKYGTDWHYPLISIVGPLITLSQAFLFYQFIAKYSNRYLYPFLFTPLYMEMLSGIMNLINPNDLGRIGQYLNIGLLTLPALFVSIHLLWNYKTQKRENYQWKFVLTTLALALVFSSIWILANQKFKVVLI